MTSRPILPFEALAALSISPENESVLSLANLPRELSLSVASFLDLKDLLNLEATSKSHNQLVSNCMNPVWKQLRDNRWAHGKLHWHAGPTFERSLDGVLVAVDNDLANWRDEVKRRVELENSLPERLARYADATAEERKDIESSLKEDGNDIYDFFKHEDDPEYGSLKKMVRDNSISFVLSGSIMDLGLKLNLVAHAAEGGDQHAFEFVQNGENDLRREQAKLTKQLIFFEAFRQRILALVARQRLLALVRRNSNDE